VVCSISGAAGEIVACPIRVAELVGSEVNPATGIQLTMQYDASKVALSFFQDGTNCSFGPCIPWTLPSPPGAFTTLQSGHTFFTDPPPQGWAGAVEILLVHTSDPSVPLTEAKVVGGSLDDGGVLSGDPVMVHAMFELKSAISASAPLMITATGISAADSDAAELGAFIEYDVIHTVSP
jgi:hypothetical protein